MSVVIPNDILTAAKISEAELKLEIAILLYQQRKLGTGTRQLAGLSLIQFRREIAKRGICINYDEEAFHTDVETLKKLSNLRSR